MKCLLDTHALVWWLLDDPKLGADAHRIIADMENDILVSAVSAFEIATKVRVGKWPEVAAIATNFETLVAAEKFAILDLTAAHARLAGSIDSEHRDPFDRMLAAQCKLDGLALVTADRAFRDFAIEIIW